MSYSDQNPYQSPYGSYAPVVDQAAASERSTFIRKTYLHLGLAVAAFALIEVAIFSLVPQPALKSMVGAMMGSPWSWLLVLGGFMFVGFIADRWAQNTVSREKQYMGLFLYVIAEAVIFIPILAISLWVPQFAQSNILGQAAVLTLVIFGGLSATVLLTKADFSFLRIFLTFGFLIALGLIVGGAIFGFNLGLWFVVGMLVLVSAAILYQTSQIVHHYRTDQYVAASLGLFASLATLFWYVLQLLMHLSSE